VVTGGSRGLGAGIVQNLLEEGYSVSTCSRSQTAFVEQLSASPEYQGRFLWLPCAVGETGAAEQFMGRAAQWAGGEVHSLVNNAGIAAEGVLATFPNVDSARIIQVNLLGAIEMSRAALRYMLRGNGGGRIVNISSIIGSRGYTGLAAYSASKAGIDGLTRSLAREVGRRGITVNSIAPGYIATEMSSSLKKDQVEQIVRRTPLGKLAEISDVAALVRFLLSDQAGCITGQVIMVDGGISC
jgi:3-oxoacyl-[acyl-carrier protein] reductase